MGSTRRGVEHAPHPCRIISRTIHNEKYDRHEEAGAAAPTRDGRFWPSALGIQRSAFDVSIGQRDSIATLFTKRWLENSKKATRYALT